jgi:predicted alpha/beta hydrolase family esterase
MKKSIKWGTNEKKNKRITKQKRRSKKMTIPIAVASVLGITSIVLFIVWLFQDSLLYSPREKYRILGAIKFDNNYIKINYGLNENDTDQTSLVQKGDSNGILWICFFGKGEKVEEDAYFINLINQDKSKNILMFRYPSYYGNPGNINKNTMNNYITNAVNKIGIDVKTVNLIGTSLGCAIALNYAVECNYIIDNIVLFVPFSSFQNVVRDVAGPVNHILSDKNRWDNVGAANKLGYKLGDRKVAIFHGDKDELVNIRHGRELDKAFGNKSEIYESPGTKHEYIKNVVAYKMLTDPEYIKIKNDIFYNKK